VLKLLGYLFAAGKLGKVALTGGTMILSVFVYALVFGWWYAVGFVGLIFVHEMGHFVAARMRGLDVGAPTFIPFVGAWVELKDMPHDVETEAYVGIAGPLAGSAAALACYFLARAYGSDLLLALSYAGFFLNLFNLIPIVPLDGGRAAGALHPALWFVGLLMMVGLVVLRPNPLLVVIVVLGGLDLWSRWRARGEAGDYYRLTVGQRVTVAVVYLGLIAALGLAMSVTHVERTF
jgi:Zn-dependent protease